MPVSASGERLTPLFDGDAELVLPVDVVGCEGDEAELEGGLGSSERTGGGERLADRFRCAGEASLQARDAGGHRVGAALEAAVTRTVTSPASSPSM
jgi:hypothetical protein